MTDLPIAGKLVPLLQGGVVADASDIAATGAGGANVQAQLTSIKSDVTANANAIRTLGGGTAGSISSLISKVNALYPLTPNVDGLNSWAGIYDPAATTEEVVEANGYSSFIDFRSQSDRYESSGIVPTFTTGVVTYANVGGAFPRCFGFSVSGPSDQVLLWVLAGGEVIPFIDMTAGGNFRVNDYTPSRAQDEDIVDHVNIVSTATAGTGTLVLNGPVTTYTIPDYPANTSTQSRRVQIEFEILDSGVDLDLRFVMDFAIPDTDVAQAATDVRDVLNIGWSTVHPVNITVRYEVRISGSDLVFDVSLVESQNSDLQLRVRTFKVLQSYTATTIIARVDNFLVITNFNLNFTFAGAQELLIAFHPIANSDIMDVVPVVKDIATGDVTQLDDRAAPEPRLGFDSIRIPDTIEFRSFLPNHFLRHIDLVSNVNNRTVKWAYGLAHLNTVSEHQVTEVINLFAGTKLDGTALVNPGKVIVHQSVNTGTGAGGLVSAVQLPTNYFNADFVYVEIVDAGEWTPVSVRTELLSQTLFTGTDQIYTDGKNPLAWTVGTRTISTKDSQQLISQVVLHTIS